jgi:DNA-binding transcriptional LysR family regulator
MRVTLDALLVLDAVDRAGSFAGGAEQLFRVPSAVSYTIHKLEQDLGVTIFDRSGHRAKLTKAGEQLLKDGRVLLCLADEIERKVIQVDAGWEARLTIAVSDAVPLSAVYLLVSAFYDTRGHESTHLQVSTEAQATCWGTLLAGRSDLVIGAPEPGPNVEGYRTQPLGEVEPSLVVPSDHPLARAREPLASDVVSHYRVVRQAGWPAGPRPGRVSGELITVDDYHSQVEAIRHGIGIGFVPTYLVQEDVEAGRLVTKRVADTPTLRLGTAWRATPTGHALGWFVDQLSDKAVRTRLVPPEA